MRGTKSGINARNVLHLIGIRKPGGTFSEVLNSEMFDNYLVDGQALDPSYFGYTDVSKWYMET